MPVGRRLAYDAIHGRLWVVCARCGEWNLTPLEERWEAIEECERLFASSEARVASGAVAIADCVDVTLVRLGDAPRSEIANTRYGPRLRGRRSRRHTVAAVAVLAGGGAVGAFSLFVASTSGSVQMGLTVALVGSFYTYFYWNEARKLRMARVRRREGRMVWLTIGEIQTATVFVQRNSRGKLLRMDLAVWTSRGDEHFSGDDALAALAAILPVLNATGASEDDIRLAVSLVDDAEAKLRPAKDATGERRDRKGRPAWKALLEGGGPTPVPLVHRTPAERFALEMAVSEEMERRMLVDSATAIRTGSARAHEVAEIADNMFVPRTVLDWIARLKSARTQPGQSTAPTVDPARPRELGKPST